MITVVSDGHDGHRIEGADGTLLGAIRGTTIRLSGFASEAAALAVTPHLRSALDAVLGRQYPGWARYTPVVERLRVVHDGAYEWASDGERPLARLRRPAPEAQEQLLGLEFVLPSYATDGVLITAATALVRALARLDGTARAATAGEPSMPLAAAATPR